MNENKCNNIKWIAVFTSIILLFAGVVSALVIAVNNKPTEVQPADAQEEMIEATIENPIALLSMGEVQVMSATAQSESSYVSQSVTATIMPSTVVDQYVTWAISWASDAALKNEDISNYVQIAEGSQGNLECTLNCLKSFRGSKAILTCTTRQGGKTTAVDVAYEGIPSSLAIGSPSGAGTYNLGKDTVGLLYAGNTYSLNLSMDNIFHDVGNNFSDFTVKVSGIGNVQYADYVKSPRGAGYNVTYDDIPTMTLDSMKDKLVSAKVENGVLKIEAKDSYFNYYESFTENSNYGAPYGTYTKHYYASVKDSEGNNPYFVVTVQHKTLGFSAQYKFFIGEEVDSVTTNTNTIKF